MTSQAIGHLKRAVGIALTGLLLALGLGGSAALALPPDGAGPDTSGTSSRVWPSSVKPGDRLNFEVSGFPANETVYIKIDDGATCSDTSHGACVYATQKLNSKGYASGSIVVPDLPAGSHWLRMLATGDVYDSETGEKLGYEGYTRRGGNSFTVVASSGSSGTTGGGSTTGGSGSTSGGTSDSSSTSGQGTTAGSASSTGTTIKGGSVAVDLSDPSASPSASPSADASVSPSAEPSAAAQESADAATAEPTAAEQPDVAVVEPVTTVVDDEPDASSSGVPVLGIAVLGGCVVLGGGALTWALLHRRKLLAAAAKPGE